MIEVPGPELLEARQRLLDGIMATWSPKRPAASPRRPVFVITTEAIEAVTARYGELWLKAHTAKAAQLALASATKASPGDGYWKAEHAARARYGTALALQEALTHG
jgi:hypothetical protein